MQPFSAIHDPYAGTTPSMRLEAAARRMRLEKIAARAIPDKPVIILKPAEPKPEPLPIVPAQSWTDRQKEIHKGKETWFLIVDEIDPVPQPVRIATIQKIVARAYHLSLTVLNSDRRQCQLVRARQIAMFFAKEMTHRSLPEIGRRFGGRDHTTVLHAVRKIERLRKVDPELADELNSLREAIRSAH